MSGRLGGFVKRARRRASLTQRQAADLAGLSVAVLRDLEQGRVAAPRSATLRRLAEALQLPAAETQELLRLGQPGQLPADDLWLQVLGPLRVRANGGDVAVESARQRLLLGLLALSPNRVVSQDELLEAVWGTQPPPGAADLLRVSASRLRRRLQQHRREPEAEHLLSAAQGGYQLCLSENRLDLLMFRRLVSQARRWCQEGELDRGCRVFAEALALWQGDPLADLVPLRAHPDVLAVGREWQAAVVEYAEAAIAVGRHGDVLPLLRHVTNADPLHEVAHAQLMVALSATGQRAAALATFEAVRDRLVEELGTDPGPELRATYEKVQWLADARDGAAPPAPVSAYRQLPPDITEFAGRAAELRALHDQLPAPGSGTAVAILAIEGMGGVGKTRLAVRLAHQLLSAGRYAGTQLYVDLRGHADQPPADPAAVLASFLHLLGVPGSQIPDDLPGRAALYRDRLFGAEGLVLLDNAASEEQVLPLLPASPDNLVVVTSRRSLALDGAYVLPLDVFSSDDAERLLINLAGGGRVDAAPAAARRVVELCGRLPLAVSLAARRLRARPSWQLADLAERLEQASQRPAGGLLGELAAGSRQLQAVFDVSYQGLEEPARRMFRLLGLLPGAEVTAETAASLAATAPLAARRLLDRLVDEHLATMVTYERYRLHDLLRDYAGEVLAYEETEPERRAATTRLLDHYLHTAARATDRLQPHRVTVALVGTDPGHGPELADRQAAVRWLGVECAALLAAVRLAAEQGWPAYAWQLAHELRVYLGLHGHVRDWVDVHEVALRAATDAGDRPGEVAIRTSLGSAYLDQGRSRDAREHLVRALALLPELPGGKDSTREATALTLLGIACKELGRFGEALRCYERTAELCAGRDPYREAAVRSNTGTLLAELGRLEEARDSYQRALELVRQTGDVDGESLLLSSLGDAYRRLGRYQDALDCLEKALAMADEHGLRPRQAYARHRLGNTHHGMGRIEEALRQLRDAWQILQGEYGDAQQESELLVDLAAAYRDTGDLDRAGTLARQGLSLAVEIGSRYQEARAHAGLSLLYDQTGDGGRAEDHRSRARALFTELGVPAATAPEVGTRAGSAAHPPRHE